MRRYRSYKFTDKHHSKKGILSSAAGALSFILTNVAMYISYTNKGDGENYLAVFGFLAIIFCICGLIAANQSLKEEEVYYFFGRVGMILNLFLFVLWIAVVGMGFLL
jgi:hypothetical protein